MNAYDPRREESTALISEILEAAQYGERHCPGRYPSATEVRRYFREVLDRQGLDAALGEARRIYSALVWPCTLELRPVVRKEPAP